MKNLNRHYPEFDKAAAIALEKLTKRYNSLALPMARQDAKYGQCKFSQKFFADPQTAMLTALGNRYTSDLEEWNETPQDDIEDAIAEYGHSGFITSISFTEYLTEVVIGAFS